MYNLFNEDTSPYTGDINISILNFVKSNLTRELIKLVMYYRENVHAVQSNHFLTRIMNQLPVSPQENLDYYYLKTLDRGLDISMSLKFTSPIYRGKVFDGMIYGKGTKEIYVVVNEDLENYRNEDWRDLKPIRVLSHPRSSIFFDPIKNEPFESEIGVAVFTLDIPMLMIQYRKWIADPNAYNREISDRSMMQFIAMCVLPNILFSHLNVAIFNRLNQWRFGMAPNEAVPRFPIGIINYTNQLDKVLLELIDKLNRNKKEFEGILRNIPSIREPNYLSVIRIPPMAITRNNKWALTLSRLPTMQFLFKHSAELNIQRNMTERNEVLRQLREMKYDRTIEQMISKEFYDEVMDIIDKDIIANA